ncbi:MAG: hypothetical protein RJQ09_14990 [Cyclobacteriaceae bacterium]
MKNNLSNLPGIALGFMMIVFGMNKFLGFIPVEPPEGDTAQKFLGTMFSSYLFVVVALAEIIGGVLIAVPKTRTLGWLILLPVIFNIVAFHFAHDFIGNGIWILPVALFLIDGFVVRNQLKTIIN